MEITTISRQSVHGERRSYTESRSIGVIAWSLGADQAGATAATSGDKNTGIYVRRRDFVAVIVEDRVL